MRKRYVGILSTELSNMFSKALVEKIGVSINFSIEKIKKNQEVGL